MALLASPTQKDYKRGLFLCPPCLALFGFIVVANAPGQIVGTIALVGGAIAAPLVARWLNSLVEGTSSHGTSVGAAGIAAGTGVLLTSLLPGDLLDAFMFYLSVLCVVFFAGLMVYSWQNWRRTARDQAPTKPADDE